jgi:hypothetical protein
LHPSGISCNNVPKRRNPGFWISGSGLRRYGQQRRQAGATPQNANCLGEVRTAARFLVRHSFSLHISL